MAPRGSMLASGVFSLLAFSLTPACGLLHLAARSPAHILRSSALARANVRPFKVALRRTRTAQEEGQFFEPITEGTDMKARRFVGEVEDSDAG